VVQPVAEGPSGILPEVAARLATSGLRVADLALRCPALDDPDGTRAAPPRPRPAGREAAHYLVRPDGHIG
jgi:hypothetical protein